jgi:transcriptional regulator with PAS, ATPase and Fis domain
VVLTQGPLLTAQTLTVPGGASASTSGSVPSLNLRQNIEWTEKETVRKALDTAKGVKKDAAELMGISQRAMSYYLAKHHID